MEKYPHLAEVLIESGLHCVLCSLSSIETLEEGAKAHGFSDKDIRMLIRKLNKNLENKKESI